MAQSPGRTLTDADYRLAESRLSYNVNPLVAHTMVHPVFLPGNRFWYRDRTPAGTTYVLVDPGSKTVSPAFDHAALAKAILAAVPDAKPAPDGAHLPLNGLALLDLDASGHPKIVTFAAFGKTLRCSVATKNVSAGTASCALDSGAGNQPGARQGGADSVLSPDGTRSAFLRDWNLWLRDTKSGTETQLTRDGVANFGYSTNNAGWIQSPTPVLVWSPDSRHMRRFSRINAGRARCLSCR